MSSVKIGVTGTRSGMNSEQKAKINEYIAEMSVSSLEIHHGDCVGVDIEFAEMFRNISGAVIVCHPPVKNELRAWHKSDIILEPKSHFARNRDIVDACDVLFVVPYQTSHQSTGGTWYTHDYAVKKGVPVIVIWPMSDHIEQLMKQGR